jgi:hypothetical protein
MKMTWVQKLYDKIKFWQAPTWYVELMEESQGIFLESLYIIGKAQFDKIKAKASEALQDESLSHREKLESIFNYCKGIKIELNDVLLSSLIGALVKALKNKGTI